MLCSDAFQFTVNCGMRDRRLFQRVCIGDVPCRSYTIYASPVTGCQSCLDCLIAAHVLIDGSYKGLPCLGPGVLSPWQCWVGFYWTSINCTSSINSRIFLGSGRGEGDSTEKLSFSMSTDSLWR